MSCWLIVRIKSSHFDRWLSKCTERGIEVYSPMIATYVRHRKIRRPRLVRCPAYPGYAFVKAESVSVLSSMSDVSGYLGPLISFGKVASLSEHEIDRLRRFEQDMEQAMEHAASSVSKEAIPLGSRVVVVAGLFEGSEGIVVLRSGQFAAVRLEGIRHTLKINTCLLRLKER